MLQRSLADWLAMNRSLPQCSPFPKQDERAQDAHTIAAGKVPVLNSTYYARWLNLYCYKVQRCPSFVGAFPNALALAGVALCFFASTHSFFTIRYARDHGRQNREEAVCEEWGRRTTVVIYTPARCFTTQCAVVCFVTVGSNPAVTVTRHLLENVVEDHKKEVDIANEIPGTCGHGVV